MLAQCLAIHFFDSNTNKMPQHSHQSGDK
jgi:hypothetical protein